MRLSQYSIRARHCQGTVAAREDFVAVNFLDPLPVFLRIPTCALGFRRLDAHEFGDRLRVACDSDFFLHLQCRFSFRPALAQVANRDRFHRRCVACFTTLVNKGPHAAWTWPWSS